MNRLHALTDGVYAIAMTLVVLSRRARDALETRSSVGVSRASGPEHTEHRGPTRGRVRETPTLQPPARMAIRAALFLNVLQLFFVALLPFSTALLGRYPDEAAAVIVYALHLEALGLAQYAHWIYVLRHPELVQAPIDARTNRATTLRILIGPAAWAAAMLLALVSARLAYAVFYVVLIGYIVAAVRDRTVVR